MNTKINEGKKKKQQRVQPTYTQIVSKLTQEIFKLMNQT